MGALRLLLALAVAGGHAAGSFEFPADWIMYGGTAVQIFYIISGFLIAMILDGKYADTPSGNRIFYANRLAKIFVPYLFVLLAAVLVSLVSRAASGNALLLRSWFDEAGTMTLGTTAFAVLTNLFILGQDWAFLLVYRAGHLLFSWHAYDDPPIASQFSVIVPAWSLSIELAFYAIAPFILRRSILLIAVLAYASYTLRFAAYHHGYYSAATDCRFFPFELSLFLWGSLSYHWYRFLNARDLLSSPASLGFTIAVCVLIAANPRWLQVKPYQVYALVGVVLPALFDFSKRLAWDRALGELSYPLYLAHWPVVQLAFFAVHAYHPAAIGRSAALPVLAVILSVGAAMLINQFIVGPVDRRRQAWAAAATPSAAPAPSRAPTALLQIGDASTE